MGRFQEDAPLKAPEKRGHHTRIHGEWEGPWRCGPVPRVRQTAIGIRSDYPIVGFQITYNITHVAVLVSNAIT